MKASEWIVELASSLAVAQPAIFEALTDPGLRMPIEWVGVPVAHKDHSGYICVGTDALRIGEPGDCVRANVDGLHAQFLCDVLGLQMPTPLMIDRVWLHAETRISPCTFTPNARGEVQVIGPDDQPRLVSMSSTSAMWAHSRRVDGFVSSGGLMCNVGKWWVIAKALAAYEDKADYRVANYGWFTSAGKSVSVTGQPVYQSVGLAHNQYHVDYSQTFVPVGALMLLDGCVMKVSEVLADPEFAHVLSHEGALPFARHPHIGSCLPDERYENLSPNPLSVRVVGMPTCPAIRSASPLSADDELF